MRRVKVRGEVVAFVVGAALLTLVGRLYRIQRVNDHHYQTLAGKQHRGVEYLEPVRGDIYTADGQVLASSLLVDCVYVDSQFVGKPPHTALTLRRVLCLSPKATGHLFRRMQEGRRFIWVKRKISAKEKRVLKRLKIPGVFFAKEHKRFFPEGALAAQVVGFCDVDDRGLAGVEKVYNDYLKGARGLREFERDGRGRKWAAPLRSRSLTKAGVREIPKIDGNHVYITIDSRIQHITEKVLDGIAREWEPLWAAAIVLDVRNGEILALTCRPTFDPNNPGRYSIRRRRNYAIADMYEPGSTFKPITFAALFKDKHVSLSSSIFCENGKWRVGARLLRDHKPYGWLSVLHVIAKSSNIGTAKCVRLMSEPRFASYIRKFGFSRPTGVDLPGEAAGQLAPVRKWSGYSLVSLAMGQEIGVTALQVAAAFAAIANGGELYRPHVLKRIVDHEGKVLVRPASQFVRRVVCEAACADLRRAMVEVVETGTGTRVKSEPYMIGGKTGTAQKQVPGVPGYAPDKYVASFCGFAPASEPRICVLVVVNEPRGWSHFGGTVAGPAVKEIIEQTLTYMRIPGDRERRYADTTAQSREARTAQQ